MLGHRRCGGAGDSPETRIKYEELVEEGGGVHGDSTWSRHCCGQRVLRFLARAGQWPCTKSRHISILVDARACKRPQCMTSRGQSSGVSKVSSFVPRTSSLLGDLAPHKV